MSRPERGLTHCADCGEDHTGHHDRTQMRRSGSGIYVTACDPSVGSGRTFGGGRGPTKAERRVAETYYRDSRRHHETVCIQNGDGYLDPRDRPAPTAGAVSENASRE